MSNYVTYLGLNFHSEGATPKDIDDRMKEIGWYPVYGPYDYAYKWEEDYDAKSKEVSEWIDEYTKVKDALKGSDVHYYFRTYKVGTEEWMNTLK